MPKKLEKKWPKNVVLREVDAIITMLGLEYIPSLAKIGKYSKCANAVKKYGGVKWLSEELGLPTARDYIHKNSWTLEAVLEELRRVMDVLGVHDRMPTQMEMMPHSTVYAAIQKFGSTAEIAAMLGVQVSHRQTRQQRKVSYVVNVEAEPKYEPPEGPFEMRDVKKSKAFDIQREAGRPYGDIQREETMRMAGTIDLSQYAGMKSYAERMTGQ